jgi:3-oxoadipate enol-lactonase
MVSGRMEVLELAVDGRPARVHAGGGGEPLVLVHGAWGGAPLHWSAVWDGLAARYHVVAPELPGFGTPGVRGLGSVAAYARWLERVLDELAVGRAFVVGNALGAAVGWRFAAEFPARCRGLALVNGSPLAAPSAPLAWARRAPLARELFRGAVRRIGFGPGALRRAYADPRRAPPALHDGLGQERPAALDAAVEVLAAGDGGAAPAVAPLIVWGEADRLPRNGVAAARRLHASLPGSRLEVVADAGHMPQVEQPARFVEVIASWAVPERAMPPRPHARRGVTTGLVAVSNGELYYEVSGDGPAVVLLHGGFLDLRMWDAQVETFTRRHRVIRYDARGHGRSSTPAHAFCHYDDLRDLLVQLGVPRAALVGHALGARTAVDFTLAYPHAVEALVAASPGLSGTALEDPFVMQQVEAMRAATLAHDGAAVVEAFLRAWADGPRRAPQAFPAALRERLRGLAADNLAKYASARGKLRELGASGRLSELRVPLLAIAGELDATDVLRATDRLAAEVPGARKLLLRGVGHQASLEDGPAFERAVLEFLAAVEGPT